jgi:predicted metal-dependent HD superfamily phosphohydrolase
VYHTDTRYADNEAQSARQMYEAMRVDTPAFAVAEMWATDVMLASELILATKGHAIKSPYLLGNAERLSDAQFFLDIDLTILSQSAEVIDQFEQDIRFEFKQYTNEQYGAGRSAAMQSFLDRERVYYTDEFHNAHEATARTNLTNIIQKWSSK